MNPGPATRSSDSFITYSATTEAGQRKLIQPDPLIQEGDEELPSSLIHLPDLRKTQQFVDALGLASLEALGMQEEDIDSLHDLGPILDLKDPSPLLRSLRHFISNASSSQAHYSATCEIELLNNPDDEFLSYDKVKCHNHWLSGVMPLEHDMCPSSCQAYTGMYSGRQVCPCCSTTQYFPGTTTPQKCFTMVQIRPIIHGSCNTVNHMHYWERRLAANVDHACHAGGHLGK